MKKLLTILGTISLGVTSSATVMACSYNTRSDIDISKNTFTSIGDLEGITFLATTFDNSIIYGANEKNIYVSENNQPFEELDRSSIPEPDIKALIVNNDVLYVAARDGEYGGLYQYDRANNNFTEIIPSDSDRKTTDGDIDINKIESIVAKNNYIYIATEGDSFLDSIYYQYNIDTKEFVKYGELTDKIFSSFTVDNDNNIYIAAGTDAIFKIDASHQLTQVGNFSSQIRVELITSYNNTIYVSYGNTIYQCSDGNNFTKTDVKVNWNINNILVDDNSHMYVGGKNTNLYSGTVVNNNINNFDLISNQSFIGTINSMVYHENILIISDDIHIYTADLKNWQF